MTALGNELRKPRAGSVDVGIEIWRCGRLRSRLASLLARCRSFERWTIAPQF